HRFGRSVALERSFSAQHLEQYRAKTKNVRALVSRFAANLLGRHIANCTHNESERGRGPCDGSCGKVGDSASVLGGLYQLRKSEIEDFESIVAGNKNVFGFQVAMNNPFVMRGRESLSDTKRILSRATKRQRPPLQFGP